MPCSGDRGPLAFRSASRARAASIAFGIERHYRVKRGTFAIVGLDTGDAELYKFFGGQRARVEGGIEVSDRRPIQINVCRRRRADIPQKQGSHKRDSSPGIHFILRNGEPLTSIGLCTTIREPY